MFENFRSKRLETKRDKALAACDLGQTLLQMGEDRSMAVEATGHEAQHAFSDNGAGYIGVRSNDVIFEAYYEPDGPRTAEEIGKMAQAVGKNRMSYVDHQVNRQSKK